MTDKLKVLDLFSGIGGFSLGLERTGGFETTAFCEIEPYCRAVLRKHWPDVPIYDDIRTLTADRLAADGIGVDLICGGFPCQDISCAGAGAGIGGERSGLWREYARLIGELRPGYVIVENVAALLGRGLGVVLGDLAALGFDAEWHCIPASAVGAPHRRDRVWIVAYPNGSGCQFLFEGHLGDVVPRDQEWPSPEDQPQRNRGKYRPIPNGPNVSDTNINGCSRRAQRDLGKEARITAPLRHNFERYHLSKSLGRSWRTEPDVGRVAHGVPSRVDRLGALGNAVVPQIPEIIGRAIVESRP
jgi:DNA (cytosine-5)-methyltransferase 1